MLVYVSVFIYVLRVRLRNSLRSRFVLRVLSRSQLRVRFRSLFRVVALPVAVLLALGLP